MTDKQGGEGLGKGINDYLNHYVLVADGKAAVLAAGSLVLVGMALSSEAKDAEPVLRLLGTLLAGVSAVLAGAVLFPRTPHSGNGHVFWGIFIHSIQRDPIGSHFNNLTMMQLGVSTPDKTISLAKFC